MCLFSASKAVTAILVHKLAEEGGIDLDARVSRYLPEFTGAGKQRTTIAQVLSHRGGFPMFDIDRRRAGPETLADWDECLRRSARPRPRRAAGGWPITRSPAASSSANSSVA